MPGAEHYLEEGHVEQFTLPTFIGRNQTFWIDPPVICKVYPVTEFRKVTVKDKQGKETEETKRVLKHWVCAIPGFKFEATHEKSSVVARMLLNDALADLALGKTKPKGNWDELKERIKPEAV